MHKLEKLLEKKKQEGKSLSPMESAAKASVLEELRSMASEHMGKKLDGLKKVSVASDSKEGLEHGLEKAREMVGSPEGEEDCEPGESEDEANETPEEQQAEAEATPEDHAREAVQGDLSYRHMDNDELNKHIEDLIKHRDSRKDE